MRSEIHVVGTGAIQNVSACISKRKKRGSHKAVRVKVVLQRRMVQPDVAHAIRPICIADVGVIERQVQRERGPILGAPNPAPGAAQDQATRGIGIGRSSLRAQIVGVLNALLNSSIVAAVERRAGTQIDGPAPSKAC